MTSQLLNTPFADSLVTRFDLSALEPFWGTRVLIAFQCLIASRSSYVTFNGKAHQILGR
jgi:hypothetical protein